MRQFPAFVVLPLMAFSGLAGCSSLPSEEPSTTSSSVRSAENLFPPGSESFVSVSVDGVPFEVLVAEQSSTEIAVSRAPEAAPALEGQDFVVLGQTEMYGRLPGPTPRVIIDEEFAFGSLMSRKGEGDITSLEDIPSTSGLIKTDGSFSPLDSVTNQVVMLPDSNQDNLYFEPQHASSNGEWVVWREGSAGMHAAMPTLGSDDWRLISWNRHTGVVSELTSAFLIHGDRSAPRSSWDVAPSTDGTTVYFEAMLPDTQTNDWVQSIISVPLNGDGEIVILDEGIMPVANPSGGASWISSDGGAGTVVTDGESLFSVGGNAWEVRRLAGSGEMLVATVTNGSSAWLVIYDFSTGQIAEVIETGSDWAEVSVAAGKLVWGNNSGSGDPMMYHRGEDHQVRALWGVQGLSAPLIHDNIVALPTETEDSAVTWKFVKWIG